MSEEIIVDVSCLEHVYPGDVRVDLCGLNFQVKRGERVAVLGPNGSGKSTLIKHVLGLLRPTKGQVRVFGEDPAKDYEKIRHRIGAVTQNVDEQLIGPTVFDDVAFAPLNFGFSREETRVRVERTLRALDIEHLRDRLPHYLSGGERKKVALAGALVFDPELLVFDEPLEGVDHTSRLEIARFLQQLHRDTGITIISTMHDIDLVGELADSGYVMGPDAHLVLHGTITDLFFTQELGRYNLAPPALVQLVKELNTRGFDLQPTLNVNELADQVQRLVGSDAAKG